MFPIDKDLMGEMCKDYLDDHADEYEDDPMILDGEPYISDDGEWAQNAHDSKHAYIMCPDSDGNIYLLSFTK